MNEPNMRCVEPVSMTLAAYWAHEYWKYNNERRLYDRERSLLRELIELRAKTTNASAQKYIDDEIHTIEARLQDEPPSNVLYDLWNLVTCGLFKHR